MQNTTPTFNQVCQHTDSMIDNMPISWHTWKLCTHKKYAY